MFFRKRKDKRIKNSIFSPWRFILYFTLIGFIVTVSFLLFFNSDSLLIPNLPIDVVKQRAIWTLFNILFLCVTLSIMDGVRKRIFTRRPVDRILEATHRITNGDFSARIKPLHKRKAFNEYDIIIEDFNKMAEELSSIETLKTDFIANVSHELKTPLAVIQNYSTMLQAKELDEETRLEYAKNLNRASRNLSDLITSILRLNKLENQQIFPTYQKFNLSEQICECMLKFEEQWEKKEIEIITELDEEIEIESDKELLDIVWSNLLSNAFKFSEKGGTVSVQMLKENQFVFVRIADTGCGMTEETGRHIFEKFYQGDTSHATKGNGLGLALVKRVIDITMGEITVESEIGKGSAFTVKLPAKRN
ncbi:MAG: HAMP domain-containing histidine kinase [Clostridia bacterium]|nr:HAMP domain-containing histidine kinase [Clostridia bacterium]